MLLSFMDCIQSSSSLYFWLILLFILIFIVIFIFINLLTIDIQL